MQMSVPQRINDFITSHKPNAVCNRCIAAGVGLNNAGAHPAQVTGALATTSDFAQKRGECSLCGETRVVIARC